VAWGLRPGTIRPEPGHDAVQLFDAIDAARIKAVWVIGTNPAASMPNLPRVRRALEKAQLVIVQDAYYPTETTRYAHVMLPAAVNLEQDGTFCNSERRVTLMRQVVPPPGDAQAGLAVGAGRGRGDGVPQGAGVRVGRADLRRVRPHDGRPAERPELAIPQAAGRPRAAAVAVPVDGGRQPSGGFTDGVFCTPSGKARLWARDDVAADERPTRDYPLLLTTGRTLNQWHTRTKTGTCRS
jgi:predicted molibdopterin-dependent oxidoreductase YjgC